MSEGNKLMKVDLAALEAALRSCSPDELARLTKAVPGFSQEGLVSGRAQLADVRVDELDASLRLYTRSQLAELSNCDPSTIHRAIADPDSPLHYTHERGRRRYISHSVAKAWLDTLRVPE